MTLRWRQRLQGRASWELGKPVPAPTECTSRSLCEESGAKTVSRSLQTHKARQPGVRSPKPTFQRSSRPADNTIITLARRGPRGTVGARYHQRDARGDSPERGAGPGRQPGRSFCRLLGGRILCRRRRSSGSFLKARGRLSLQLPLPWERSSLWGHTFLLYFSWGFTPERLRSSFETWANLKRPLS